MVLYGQPVRASTTYYSRFTLLMASSSRFGSYPYPIYFALFTLAFTVPPWDCHLDWDKGTLAGSFFNRHAVTPLLRLRLLVGVWFQIYFTPLSGVLFTFPSRYLFTIGHQEYLALPVSSGGFIRAIRVSDYSGTESKESDTFRIQGYYLLGPRFPTRFPIYQLCNSSQLNANSALQPHTYKYVWFGLFPFRSPLLGESQGPSS